MSFSWVMQKAHRPSGLSPRFAVMYLLIFLVLVTAIIILFLRSEAFGSQPSGDRIKRIERSPHYREGAFQNLSPTPALAEGESYLGVMRKFFFGKDQRNVPSFVIPSSKTDLKNLDTSLNILVWFGHSSYFMQIDGTRILVDPVFSGHASPLSFTTKSFKGSDVYRADEFPPIDLCFISHDHWDHLDHKTTRSLTIRKIITGLGVGAHLERWGMDPSMINELDWNESMEPLPGFKVHAVPARHFSGRGFKRNGSLWTSFALITPSFRLFIGGDSGYDSHFKKAGDDFGPFDFAILENGQYDPAWKYIHMLPEEVVQAGEDLRAEWIIPVHWSKFSLSVHAWDDPIKRVVAEAKRKNRKLLHPMIGEAVDLDKPVAGKEWWEGNGEA